MPPPEEFLVSVLEIDAPSHTLLEIITEPASVLEIGAGVRGPAGPTGPTGPSGPTGATGPTGPGVHFQGTWSSTTAYDLNDFVSWDGAVYFTTGQGEVGVPPSDNGGITVRSGWYLAARSGDIGSTGPTGPTGPPGTGSGTITAFATDLSAGDFVMVEHGLGTEDVLVQLRVKSTGAIVYSDIEVVDDNNVSVLIGHQEDNPVDATYRIVVVTGFWPDA